MKIAHAFHIGLVIYNEPNYGIRKLGKGRFSIDFGYFSFWFEHMEYNK